MELRIGIVGGTFDPIHRAHVEIPLRLAGDLGWDHLLYVPAWQQPFKGAATSPFHRHAMIVLATRELERVKVSLLELERESVSYTVDTLDALREQFPEASLEWVIGEDNLGALDRWKNVPRLFELANFVVLRREGTGASAPESLADRVCAAGNRPRQGAIIFANNSHYAVSSTEIRQRVAAGTSVEGLVHPDVMHYIRRTGLYQNAR